MTTPALELRRVSCSLDRRPVLRELDLTLAAGGFHGLLGPSGAGKTTLLRVVAGLQEPDAGELSIGGRLVWGARARVPAPERGLGMVFQDLALWPHMTVRQHLEFVLPAERWSEAIPAWLERVGLGGRGQDCPGQLSGGERQRLALARALAPGPRLLLLDEPFKSLDEPLADRLGGLVKELAEAAGATTLMVSHGRLQALKLCDTLVFLCDGVVAVAGPARAMLDAGAPPAAREFFASVPRASH